MTSTHSLFVACTLHEVAVKNSAAPLETEGVRCRHTLCSLFFTKFAENTLEATREKGEGSVGVLFVVCTIHEFTRKDSVETREKEDSVGVLFVVSTLSTLHEVARKNSASALETKDDVNHALCS